MTNEEYIQLHRQDDVRRLALSHSPKGIDQKWCLQQIEGWQIARKKLPLWSQTEGLWYGTHLAMEQCSSEQTAQYKRRLAERLIPQEKRASMADLTGGLGVDFSYIAPLFREATYVEIQPQLVELARHNLPLLGMGNEKLTIIHATEPNKLPLFTSPVSLIYLDPSRRDTTGRKTVSIADCTPNLLEIQDELCQQARVVMLKLSPMLDIHQALRELKGVREVHIVSVLGECKELLFVISTSASHTEPISLHCVNLGTEEDEVTSYYPLPTREHGSLDNPSFQNENFMGKCVCPTGEATGEAFLYEPNASILKAGVQDMLCQRYPVGKLHPLSNLFVADSLIPHFPGRRFRIMGWSDFSKKGLKKLIGGLRQSNLTVRNFPTPVATLRRQLRLTEGGDTYLFATTMGNENRHILIRCQKTS